MATAKKLPPFEEVTLFYDQAAERLDLTDGCREMLCRPWGTCRFKFRFGWTMATSTYTTVFAPAQQRS